MTEENILFDDEVMKAELYRILHHLEHHDPVPSHVWLSIHHPGVAEGAWSGEHLAEFLTLFHAGQSGTTVYTIWSMVADNNPMEEAECINGDSQLLAGGTAVNMTDFMLMCVRSTTLMTQHQGMLIRLIGYPWRYVINEEPDILTHLNDTLIALMPDENDDRHFPHHNAALQRKEYKRVFSALEKGDLIPSHWQLFLTFNGDKGGDHWDAERIMACLKDMRYNDEGNNLNVVWLSEPRHILDNVSRHQLRTEKGETFTDAPPAYLTTCSAINLADFIWLCCQQEEVVHTRLVIIVIMLVLYPFRRAVGDDRDLWIERTINSLKQIHQATKQHITH